MRPLIETVETAVMPEPIILIAGASRGVGRQIAQLLTAQSHPVVALLRHPVTAPELEALGAKVVPADALDRAQVDQAMVRYPIHTVISTIGGMPADGVRSDYLGNRNLIDAALAAGAQRFVLITSIGSGDSVVALPDRVLAALGPVLAEKAQAEQHLIHSGLDYTIIRPGGLKSEPATGNGVLTTDPRLAGSIHRADVAQLVGRCWQSPKARNQVLSAADRDMLYGVTDFVEFLP
jgi:nucleoside-diphosphate-sugar epimerase